MKLPIGRFGIFQSRAGAHDGFRHGRRPLRPDQSRACAARLPGAAASCISPSSSLETGTPVQRLTTSAISSSSTSSFSRRVCPVSRPLLLFASSCASSSRSLPYFSSAALFRSYARSACSISSFVCSICSRRLAQLLHRFFLGLPLRLQRRRLGLQIGQFFFEFRQPLARSCVGLFLQASRSISSCMMRRRISSSSAGIESISVRSFAAASSTRSMALSGRKRSEM